MQSSGTLICPTQRHDLETEISQAQVVNDLALEHIADVRAPWAVESGEYLVSRARPANLFQPLQHKNRQSILGQVSGSDQTIVARSDYNGIVLILVQLGLQSTVRTTREFYGIAGIESTAFLLTKFLINYYVRP